MDSPNAQSDNFKEGLMGRILGLKIKFGAVYKMFYYPPNLKFYVIRIIYFHLFLQFSRINTLE